MIRRALITTFFVAVVFTFIMAVLPQPPRLPGAPTDKIQHILAFVVLTVLGSAAYPRQRPIVLVAGLAVFGALIEVVQMIPALHRFADINDWLADMAAVLISLGIVTALRRAGWHLP